MIGVFVRKRLICRVRPPRQHWHQILERGIRNLDG
jgi:hypothetical protein